MYWNRVMESECPQPEGCDSIAVDTILHGYLDVDKCFDPVADTFVTNLEEWQCASLFDGTGVWHAGSLRIVNGSITVEVPDPFICGDANADQGVNILDVVYIINYKYKGGPEPDCCP